MRPILKGDEVIADIVRCRRKLAAPGVVRAVHLDMALVIFPALRAEFRDGHAGGFSGIVEDWEWVPLDKLSHDPYARVRLG